jgi:hypothetical protein
MLVYIFIGLLLILFILSRSSTRPTVNQKGGIEDMQSMYGGNSPTTSLWGSNYPLAPEKTVAPYGMPLDRDPQDERLATQAAFTQILPPYNQPDGHRYRRREHIGWRWKEGWRPYFWRNYPGEPVWLPARPEGNNGVNGKPTGSTTRGLKGEGPPFGPPLNCIPDRMEQGAMGEPSPTNWHKRPNKATTHLGHRYTFDVRPPYQPLCTAFASQKCRGEHYPHFCFRRNYAKCINGVL